MAKLQHKVGPTVTSLTPSLPLILCSLSDASKNPQSHLQLHRRSGSALYYYEKDINSTDSFTQVAVTACTLHDSAVCSRAGSSLGL